jgi:glycogen synthase
MRVVKVGIEWFTERPGGCNRQYYDMVRWMAKGGVDVRGLVAGSARPAVETGGLVESFCPADAPLPRRLGAARAAMRRLMRSFDPDLVASHFALYTLPFLDFLHQPFVVHFHGPWALESAVEGSTCLATNAKRWLERSVYRRAQRHIVLSRAFGEILHRRYDVPWERIRVVPGGIEVDRFDLALSRPAARARLGWPTDRYVLLAIRRLVRRMGLENLLAALAEVRRRHPDVMLMLGGRGSLAPELERLVDEWDLREHVRFLGHVPDELLPVAYRAADLSVVPSVALEGFGLTTIESLAAGTPVLVTPVGGLPEAVRGLSEDLVLPGASTEYLIQYLDQIVPGNMKLPSEQDCRSYARNHFDWRILITEVTNVYREAQQQTD